MLWRSARAIGRSLGLIAAAVGIWCALAGFAEACPMCAEALANEQREGGNLVKGFFWSIVFMLSMPFVTLGGLSAYMYTLVRKARAARKAGDPAYPGQRSHPAADSAGGESDR